MQDVTPSSAPVTTAPEPKKYDRRWALGLGAVFGGVTSYAVARLASQDPAVDVVYETLSGSAISGVISSFLTANRGREMAVKSVVSAALWGATWGVPLTFASVAYRQDAIKNDRIVEQAQSNSTLNSDQNICGANKLQPGAYRLVYDGADGKKAAYILCHPPAPAQ